MAWNSYSEQLHRSAIEMTTVEPLTPEYEKAVERHNMLYPAVKSARDELTAAAGLAGLPQIVLPVGAVAPATVSGGGGPVGLSFIGPRGSDAELLELGVEISRAMGLSPGCK